MQIVGLEPRRSDLARGIVIARAAAPLGGEAQRALWQALEACGLTEIDDEEEDDDEERQWLVGPWLPPDEAELAVQRAALEELGTRYGLEAVWLVKVETEVDADAWIEAVAAVRAHGERESEEAADAKAEASEVEVVYAAPGSSGARELGAPADVLAAAAAEDGDEDAGDEDDEDELDDDDLPLLMRSYWRAGPPPQEDAVPFPIERYPDILDDYDPESFGMAIKLSGPSLPGEQVIVNAFFELWLSIYRHERMDEQQPFHRAHVVHDRAHRTALFWAEGFEVPATAAEQVGFLLWIAARIHEIVPISWARFEQVDEAVRARANPAGDTEPLILAGNPFADRFRRYGEDAAQAWAVGQSAWSRRELAAMFVEVALAHDPDDAATAAVAERLLRRALAYDPRSDATGYLAIVLVRQHRVGEAIALVGDEPGRERGDDVLLILGEVAEHAADELPAALALLDDRAARGVIQRGGAEELSDLVQVVAKAAPEHLGALLARLPPEPALVPHLYNASFAVERPSALAILRAVLAMPEPPPGTGEARTALVMAWNNACIHAHALGDYALAAELADGGQRFAGENPYIHHSAACAYVATSQIDRAIEQVSQAIDRNYEHSEKMETDADLAPLRHDPRFTHLFSEWRARRVDLN